jgi:hypothetical protein
LSKEDLAAIVLMPAVMREIWKDPEKAEDIEASLETCAAYKKQLDGFAMDETEKTPEFYERFRTMLSRFSLIFQKDYALVEFIDNEQIDYALEQVRTAREAYALEQEILTVK